MNARSLAVAAAALAALSTTTFAADDKMSSDKMASMEKCYGVSLAGKNDCAAGAGTSCAGTQKSDYEADHFKNVAKGTCTSIKTPKGTGSLTPAKA